MIRRLKRRQKVSPQSRRNSRRKRMTTRGFLEHMSFYIGSTFIGIDPGAPEGDRSVTLFAADIASDFRVTE